MPSPNSAVHSELIKSAIDVKCHIQITAFTISICTLMALHHAVILGVDKQAAVAVVVVVSLDASGQCGQFAICQINSVHTVNFFVVTDNYDWTDFH